MDRYKDETIKGGLDIKRVGTLVIKFFYTSQKFLIMEKLMPYEREHMKMAMLKHEETFKHQVNELHRLYRIQKILMKGVENNKPKKPNHQGLNHSCDVSLNQTNKNPSNFHQNSKLRFVEESKGDKELEIEDESDIQLTLGPTRYKKTETSDSGLSFSSSSTGSSHVIKWGNQGLQKNLENLAWGQTMVTTDLNSGYHSRKNNGYRVQGRLNQPPWLLQALSNMS